MFGVKNTLSFLFREQMSGPRLKHITQGVKIVSLPLKERDFEVMSSVCRFVFSRNILTVSGPPHTYAFKHLPHIAGEGQSHFGRTVFFVVVVVSLRGSYISQSFKD